MQQHDAEVPSIDMLYLVPVTNYFAFPLYSVYRMGKLVCSVPNIRMSDMVLAGHGNSTSPFLLWGLPHTHTNIIR